VGERRRAVRPGCRRLSIQLPEEMVGEIFAVAGRNPSRWIEQVLRERLEEERRRRLLRELPTPLREKLVKTAGSEEAATRLLIKVIEKGLVELEEDEVEEAAQEAIGFAHRQEMRRG